MSKKIFIVLHVLVSLAAAWFITGVVFVYKCQDACSTYPDSIIYPLFIFSFLVSFVIVFLALRFISNKF